MSERNDDTAKLVTRIEATVGLLTGLIEKLPPGRRRAVALTHLETVEMWAVKAAKTGDD